MPKQPAPHPMKSLKRASVGDVGRLNEKGKKAGASKAEARAILRLERAESEIRAMCELVGCSPTVSDVALEIFVASENDKLFGLNPPRDPTTAAYVLEASRRSLEPLSFRELSSAIGVDKHKIGRYHKELLCYFMRKTAADGDFSPCQIVLGPSEPLELWFIRRYARALGLSKQASVLATRFGQVAHTDAVRVPSDVAASIVLFATAVAGEDKAVEDVGIISNMSTAQLRLGVEKLQGVKGLVHEGFVDAVMLVYGIDRQTACKKLYPK